MENNQVNVTPMRFFNTKNEEEIAEQKKILFQKWTFIANI